MNIRIANIDNSKSIIIGRCVFNKRNNFYLGKSLKLHVNSSLIIRHLTMHNMKSHHKITDQLI